VSFESKKLNKLSQKSKAPYFNAYSDLIEMQNLGLILINK